MPNAAISDRVLETTTDTGTGSLVLAGAALGYRSFASAYPSAIALPVYYCIEDSVNWEVGVGAYTASTTTLARTTLLASSTGSFVSFPSGTKRVFNQLPAEYIRLLGPAGIVLTDASSIAIDASAGNKFYLLTTSGVGATRAIANPTNPRDGVVLNFVFKTDAASRLVTFGSKYKFTTPPVMSATSGAIDLMSAVYDATLDLWLGSYGNGFA